MKLALLAILIASTAPALAQETIIPDISAIPVVCAQTDQQLQSIENAVSGQSQEKRQSEVERQRLELGLACRYYFWGLTGTEGWFDRLTQLVNNAAAGANVGQTYQPLASPAELNIVPTGKQAYHMLFLADSPRQDAKASNVYTAFYQFGKGTNSDHQAIAYVNDQSQPDVALEIAQCRSLFKLPLCGTETYVVTTAVRPDLRTGNVVVLDMSKLSASELACFFNELAKNANGNQLVAANIIDTIKRFPYFDKAVNIILKPVGTFQQPVVFVVKTTITTMLPCTV